MAARDAVPEMGHRVPLEMVAEVLAAPDRQGVRGSGRSRAAPLNW